MAGIFGQPRAYNRWFGNDLIIPEAQQSQSPLVNVGNTASVYPGFGHSVDLAPPPPPVPGAVMTDQQRRMQEYSQGGSTDAAGTGFGGGDGSYGGTTEYDPTAPELGFGDVLGKAARFAATKAVPLAAIPLAAYDLWGPKTGGLFGTPDPADAATHAAQQQAIANTVAGFDGNDSYEGLSHGEIAARQQASIPGAPQGPGHVPAHISIGSNLTEREIADRMAAINAAKDLVAARQAQTAQEIANGSLGSGEWGGGLGGDAFGGFSGGDHDPGDFSGGWM